MNNQTIQKFSVIGISVRTTNENGQVAHDIPALWSRFMSESVADNIPNKINNTLYCMYTDYEKDHTKPYTAILGCRVDSLDVIPSGMVGLTIEEGLYSKFVAKGDLMQGAVFNEWNKIWNANLDRVFTVDFEVYDEKSIDMKNAEVDIFIAIKE